MRLNITTGRRELVEQLIRTSNVVEETTDLTPQTSNGDREHDPEPLTFTSHSQNQSP